MKILSMDELPADLDTQFAALTLLDGDLPWGRPTAGLLSRLGVPYSEDKGFAAVERDRVLGRIETYVVPYRTPAGTEPAVWVSGVVTDPGHLGRGVASALLKEAHLRERGRGHRWAFLWTHRSWGAHRLYESLGYRDAYSPPAAARRLTSRAGASLSGAYTTRAARASEADLLERLLHASTRSRYGFVPRTPGSFRTRFRLGWRRASDHMLLLRDSVPVGYAFATKGRLGLMATEVVVTQPRGAASMLDALERRTGNGWLALARTTFITDNDALLRRRGYQIYGRTHPVMMAKPLMASSTGPRSADPFVLYRNPRFSFQGGDSF